jgi:hypothetical protein
VLQVSRSLLLGKQAVVCKSDRHDRPPFVWLLEHELMKEARDLLDLGLRVQTIERARTAGATPGDLKLLRVCDTSSVNA